jgi:hypothetical protein
MLLHAALLLGCIAAEPLPLVFLFPEQMEDATQVRIEAQAPGAFHTLIPADPAQPKLWYAPAAALQKGDEIQVWYQRVNKTEKEYADQRTLCLATLSPKGWTIPVLHPESPAWGGPNNVVMRRSPHPPTWGGFNVFQILQQPDGFHMLYWDQPEQGNAGAMLATSPDGVNWTKDPRGTVFTETNDAFTMVRKGDAYLLYQTALEDWPDKPYADNLDKKRRVQTLRESKNLIHWTPQTPVLRPDPEDAPETEFYLMKVFPYGGAYAGLIMKYFADPARPKEHSAILKTELVVSPDARQWLRPFRKVDVACWSYADPFVFEGKHNFAIWKDGSMRRAEFPLFGLTAVVTDNEGEFVTPAFNTPGGKLQLHAAGSEGWIDVTILDAAKQPLKNTAPYRIERPDGNPVVLPWTVPQEVPCRLKLHLHQARVFAVSTANR